MQYLNEAIRIAIEKGGYAPTDSGEPVVEYSIVDKNYIWVYEEDGTGARPTFNDIVVDPLFWQALGKALGWNDEKIEVGPILHEHNGELCGKVFCETVGVTHKAAKWKVIAHQYFDLVLTGGDTEKFWKELLNQ